MTPTESATPSAQQRPHTTPAPTGNERRRRENHSAADRWPGARLDARHGVCSHLLTALIFTIPLTTFGANTLALLLLLAWLLRADFRSDWRAWRQNGVVAAALGFFALHAVGLLWTADLPSGLDALRKEWKFLLLPVFMACARVDHAPRYLASFVAAMALLVCASYAIHLELVAPFNRATVANPVPYATHVVYGPLLALAIYLVARRLLFPVGVALPVRLLMVLLLAGMVGNLFLVAGRMGYVGVFAAGVLLCFQRWPWRRAAVLALALCGGGAALAYAASDTFRERLETAVAGARGEGGDASVLERIAYAKNALAVIAEQPLLGVGTGDLGAELEALHARNSPQLTFRANPHNMYLLLGARFGVLGLAALLWLFVAQALAARRSADRALAQIGFALPVLYAVFCLGESYLAVHATSLLFAAFSAFLYRPRSAAPAPNAGASSSSAGRS